MTAFWAADCQQSDDSPTDSDRSSTDEHCSSTDESRSQTDDRSAPDQTQLSTDESQSQIDESRPHTDDPSTADESRPQTDESRPIAVEIDGTTHRLSRSEAIELREALGSAVATRETFVRSAVERRPNGAYAVFRRGDDEPAKVFDSAGEIRAAYRSLPTEFTAGDVTVVSGSRRHLLVRHFVEHPGFDCRLTCRNPLRVRKRE